MSFRLIYSVWFCFVVLTAALALDSPARAGWINDAPVFVSISGLAGGTVRGAKNSPDHIQHIGCWSNTFANFVEVGCAATDSSAHSLGCRLILSAGTWQSQYLLATITSVNDSSSILFATDPATGTCDWIMVTNASEY